METPRGPGSGAPVSWGACYGCSVQRYARLLLPLGPHFHLTHFKTAIFHPALVLSTRRSLASGVAGGRSHIGVQG
jgi:hypothetical protein